MTSLPYVTRRFQCSSWWPQDAQRTPYHTSNAWMPPPDARSDPDDHTTGELMFTYILVSVFTHLDIKNLLLILHSGGAFCVLPLLFLIQSLLSLEDSSRLLNPIISSNPHHPPTLVSLTYSMCMIDLFYVFSYTVCCTYSYGSQSYKSRDCLCLPLGAGH